MLAHISETRDVKELAWQTISKNRRMLLPYGAVAMAESEVMKPSKVVFSCWACGKASSNSMLDDEERAKDPLLGGNGRAGAAQCALTRTRTRTGGVDRQGHHGFSGQETEVRHANRQAACYPRRMSAGARIPTIAASTR